MLGTTNAVIQRKDLVMDATYPFLSTSSYNSSTFYIKDGDYLYCRVVGFLTGYLGKVLLSDMTETHTTNLSSINALILNGDYLYAAIGNYCNKYAKSDFSLVQQSTSYGAAVYTVVTDGTHIYIGGATTKTIRKYAVGDLTSLVAESSALANTIINMVYANNMLYVFSGTNVYAYDTATLTLQTTSVALGFTVSTLVIPKIDGDYVYFKNNTYIYKLDLATLGTLTSIDMLNLSAIYDFKIVGSTIYVVGDQEAINDILLYETCTTSLASETAVSSRNKIVLSYREIYVDTDYIYLGYAGSTSILKIKRSEI